MNRILSYLMILWVGLCYLLEAQTADPSHLEAACRSQMRIIHEALVYYRDANDGELPKQLGELVGDYLASDMLYCPAAREKGETASGEPGLIDLSATDGRLLGYKWELAVDSYTKTDTKNRIFQWMDYKKQQMMTQAGPWVPLVRCEHHMTAQAPHKRLNLSLNGTIYSSELYWETMFVDLVPFQYLAPDLIEFSIKPLVSFMRQRSEKSTPYMIDLRPYANAMPEHPWIWGNWGEELDEFSSSLQDGIFSSHGVHFDISGIVQLNGILGEDKQRSFVVNYFPRESKNIKVSPRFKKIHLLGGVVFASDLGAKVAFLELLSSDGTSLSTIPWEYGSDVIDVFQVANSEKELTGRYKLAWKEEVFRKGTVKTLSLLQMEFPNRVADQEVDSIQLRAGDHYSSPFILGLTLEP